MALADVARTDKVLDGEACNRDEEVCVEPVESFLDSLVAGPVRTG
jgi:hypothetical protein